MDHVRLLLADTPCAPRPIKRDGAAHTQRLRRKAETVITREFLEREYVRGHRTIKQIAVQTRIPRYMVSKQVRALGFTLGTGGLPAVDIDQRWLREQYLQRKRSFAAIAAELGVSDSTVARLATTYGIPARPAGIASHPQMIRKLGPDVPRCVRAAVEDGLHGWQRLARFETAMTFPTLKAAAEHLGAHPTALVTQFQRLERDIGTPLYHGATPARPLLPTSQGSSLLRVLRQPDIRRLLLAEASGGHRHFA
jgi:AraC-like DNA-binding protein